MITVSKDSWNSTPDELQIAVDAYKQALEDHKFTVGVPAPLPTSDLVYHIVKNGGGEFELIDSGADPSKDVPVIQSKRDVILVALLEAVVNNDKAAAQALLTEIKSK